jgi:hypothetical protein
MNDLVVTNNAVAINSELKIGMQDIVSVGVAKMEKQLKMSIKELQEKNEGLKKERQSVEKQFEAETILAIPQDILDIETELEEMLKKLKDQSVDHKIEANMSRQINNYSMRLKRKQGYSGEWLLANGIVPFSEKQKELQAKMEEIDDKVQKVSEASIVIKKKLHDVDSLERQMRARVIENQIKKTSNGQELLDTIMEQFDADLEMIG